jgi:hypothetical protein
MAEVACRGRLDASLPLHVRAVPFGAPPILQEAAMLGNTINNGPLRVLISHSQPIWANLSWLNDKASPLFSSKEAYLINKLMTVNTWCPRILPPQHGQVH